VTVATQPSESAELGGAGRDVRASRPYLLSGGTIRSFVRRLLAIVVLALLDAAGIALGLYGALVLRSLLFGEEIFWNLLWETGPAEWLPFLIPITWLVFWQAGLYASRERRSGFGRIASSLLLVALITLAFGWGTDYDFTTSGLIPTAFVASALVVGGLRAAYESLTLEMQRLLNVRRRVLLVGEGEHLAQLHRSLAASRRLLAYDVVGSFAPGEGQAIDQWLAHPRPDEIILNEGDLPEDVLLDVVETAHRAGVRVRIAPRTTELLLERGEYVPGQGAPLFELRPPILAGADWAVKKAFDLGVSVLVVVVGLPVSRSSSTRVGRCSIAISASASASGPSGCSSSGRWCWTQPRSRRCSRSGTRRRGRSSRSARTRG
jgi:hypothetical protein